MALEDYMRVAEAAQELDVSPRQVRTLVRRGTLRARLLSRRLYLVERASVEQYKSERRPRGRPRRGL